MSYPQTPPSPDDDQMLRAMKSANRKPLLVVLSVIGAIILGSGLWVLQSYGAARSDLEADGYRDVKITFHPPFNFSFSGKKGTSSCAGTMTRYPGSTSTEESCFDEAPKELAGPAEPPVSNRQRLENWLREKYAKLGFTKFTCPELSGDDNTATCTLATDEGASVTSAFERTAVEKGMWMKWTSKTNEPVFDSEVLSQQLTKSVAEQAKNHQGLAVDCGKNPVIFEGGKHTCKVTSTDAKPVNTTILVTKSEDGEVAWTGKGL